MIATLRRGVRWLLEFLLRVFVSIAPARLVVLVRSSTGLVRRMDYPNAKILLHVDSEVEYTTRLKSCSKEPGTIEWIETFFDPRDVFYDVGANVGAYSLVASTRHGGSVRVFAFEPSAVTYAQLVRNIQLNGVAGRITALPLGLSDRTARQVLEYHDLFPGGALHAIRDESPIDVSGRDAVLRQPVLTYRLDELVEQFQLPAPTHIKIDVDGHELRVLSGAAKTLEASALRSLLIEIDDAQDQARLIIEYLAARGLYPDSKYEFESCPNSRMCNYIFRRRARPSVPLTPEAERAALRS